MLITRVVDTMVNTPRPTRAEATDVANAVLDGVDGILLGAETLRGKYPVDTVKTVASICRCEGRKCGESVLPGLCCKQRNMILTLQVHKV